MSRVYRLTGEAPANGRILVRGRQEEGGRAPRRSVDERRAAKEAAVRRAAGRDFEPEAEAGLAGARRNRHAPHGAAARVGAVDLARAVDRERERVAIGERRRVDALQRGEARLLVEARVLRGREA